MERLAFTDDFLPGRDAPEFQCSQALCSLPPAAVEPAQS
jgi:hypothetical protein